MSGAQKVCVKMFMLAFVFIIKELQTGQGTATQCMRLLNLPLKIFKQNQIFW